MEDAMRSNRAGRGSLRAIAGGAFRAETPPPRSPHAVPGPVVGTRITETYARLVARDALFWAWPLVNVYNRRLAARRVPEPGLLGGAIPVAPLNRLSMLPDPVAGDNVLACPNQDVVHGAGSIALDVSPVVIQVPHFGGRFWVYQILDVRTDSFADLGAMYATEPGFYLFVGPDWRGEVPPGIAKVFRSPTNTGFVVPCVFVDDTPRDAFAVRSVIGGIDMYPLAEFDGSMKRRDWRRQRSVPALASGERDATWVLPGRIFDELPAVLADAPPLPGEAARYAQLLAVLQAASADRSLRRAMIDEAVRADAELLDPVFQFRNVGLSLRHHWTTLRNGAAFGTDYFTRTAVARSNIFVTRPNEITYFYQDLDWTGERLSGESAYTVSFARGELPPVRGLWSLSLYDERHHVSPNRLRRFAIGTRNRSLGRDADGSVTIHVSSDSPGPAAEPNWLPAPESAPFSLCLRACWPDAAITDGVWTPPPVVRIC
jgi:hypothetical protein